MCVRERKRGVDETLRLLSASGGDVLVLLSSPQMTWLSVWVALFCMFSSPLKLVEFTAWEEQHHNREGGVVL